MWASIIGIFNPFIFLFLFNPHGMVLFAMASDFDHFEMSSILRLFNNEEKFFFFFFLNLACQIKEIQYY